MVAGLVLAAGRSRRMAGECKLLLELGGVPLVRRVALALCGGGLAPVVAVVALRGGAVERVLAGLGLTVAVNPSPEEGLSSSIATGISALPPDCTGVAVALGDMPLLSASSVGTLAAFFEQGEKGIVVPVLEGRRGHPVLFRLPEYRDALMRLRGDVGARGLLDAHRADVAEVPVPDPGVLIDVDTPEDWSRLSCAGARSSSPEAGA